MKKLLTIIAALVAVAHTASAQYTTSQETTRLISLGMTSELANELTSYMYGGNGVLANNVYLKARNAANTANLNLLKADATDDTQINSDSGDFIYMQIASDAQRLFTWNASSDTALTYTFGDSGTTAVQGLFFGASTADADDDSTLTLGGGGAGSVTRGARMILYGNEVASTGGGVFLDTGNTAGADLTFDVTDDIKFATNAGTVAWTMDTTTGLFQNNVASTSDLALSATGTTIAIQEATAGSACSGTLTATGATPVVTSTTCAQTGARVFLSRTSAETGTVNAWQSAMTNGVSFAVTSEAADTGTYNWFILHEAP